MNIATLYQPPTNLNFKPPPHSAQRCITSHEYELKVNYNWKQMVSDKITSGCTNCVLLMLDCCPRSQYKHP